MPRWSMEEDIVWIHMHLGIHTRTSEKLSLVILVAYLIATETFSEPECKIVQWHYLVEF